jgi:hypothetical protein
MAARFEGDKDKGDSMTYGELSTVEGCIFVLLRIHRLLQLM